MEPNSAEFVRLLFVSRWSKAHAARQLGISPSVVTRYVQGQVMPSITVLRLFAALTGEQLRIPGEAASVAEWNAAPRFLEPWEGELMKTFRRIEPGRRARVVAAVNEILDAIGAWPKRPTSPINSDPDHEEAGDDIAGKLVAQLEEDHRKLASHGKRSPTRVRKGEPSNPP